MHMPVAFRLFLVAVVVRQASRAIAVEDGLTGAEIYRVQCARCHGATGQGTDATQNHPLIGDQSIGQLTRLIEKTMPEDDVGSCVGDSAQRVATFIHETFYSTTARARNEKARVELARLTVPQYRNVVADLVGSFREPVPEGARIGLRGEYFTTEKERLRVMDRTDPVVSFDFGEGSPQAESIPADGFFLRWQGSIFAPETGRYEFVIRTQNGMRLWVNDTRQPLIDAEVRSGTDPHYRASIFLLAGRNYPIRLEMTKSKNSKEKKSAIELRWKIPGGVEEVVPQRFLSPARGGGTFVVNTPFPPDDRSAGYERGSNVSKAWDQATTDAALEVAAYVVKKINELASVGPDAPDRDDRLRAFCMQFAERAFRRPLTSEEVAFFITRQFGKPGDSLSAIKRVVLLVLKSGDFLYVDPDATNNSPEILAARLAIGLWDSLPDQPLRDAVKAGRLVSSDDVRREAERMQADPRTRAKLREFFMLWLHAENAPELAKDPKIFPEFSPTLAADLRTSLQIQLDEIALNEAADLRELFLSNFLHLNGRLAQFYGQDLPLDAPFQRVTLGDGNRVGLMTHPYLASMLAYSGSTSPIHRGVFLYRNVLGRSLRPPPVAVAPLAPDLEPSLTTRQRVALQTSPESCQTCHGQINPLGFALEAYDAVGRFRSRDNQREIDSTGSYIDSDGKAHSFAGAFALGAFLADSEDVQKAFIEQLFHHMVKQPVAAFGPGLLEELRLRLVEQKFSIRKLMVDIMVKTVWRGSESVAAANHSSAAGAAGAAAHTLNSTAEVTQGVEIQ